MIHLSVFFRQAAFLFLALRAADFINLAAGMWLVPKYVERGELGAVLPVVTFATTLALPAFAFAFVLMKESNRLAAERAFGQLKSLLKGAFLGTSALVVVSFAASLAFLPRFADEMKVDGELIPFVAVGAAFLGCFAPVYQDALNGLKRFGAYGLAEIAAATARVGVMLLIMPFRALLGFFAGNAAQPLVRIAASLVALRKELCVKAEGYWTRPVCKQIALLFLGVLASFLPPMLASLAEQSLIRTALPADDSAAYYLMTRLTDLLNYLTLPILLVLFPYAAEAAGKGESTRPLVLKSSLAALVGALILGIIYAFCGDYLLHLLSTLSPSLSTSTSPSTSTSTSTFSLHLLLAINLLTAFQVFYTNAEIAAGRFRFLYWFIPLHLAYLAILNLSDLNLQPSTSNLLTLFLSFAALRALFALYGIIRRT